MSLRRLSSTRHPSSGRVTTDMLEAARIVFCWHFCWHSRVEVFQILAAHTVQTWRRGSELDCVRDSDERRKWVFPLNASSFGLRDVALTFSLDGSR